MYAIIETGGKQYKVQSGDVLFIEKLDASEETAVTFDKVIALHNDKDLKLGAPYIKGASVDARVLKQGKGKKITVFTYRPKKGSSRKMGHRLYQGADRADPCTRPPGCENRGGGRG